MTTGATVTAEPAVDYEESVSFEVVPSNSSAALTYSQQKENKTRKDKDKRGNDDSSGDKQPGRCGAAALEGVRRRRNLGSPRGGGGGRRRRQRKVKVQRQLLTSSTDRSDQTGSPASGSGSTSNSDTSVSSQGNDSPSRSPGFLKRRNRLSPPNNNTTRKNQPFLRRMMSRLTPRRSRTSSADEILADLDLDSRTSTLKHNNITSDGGGITRDDVARVIQDPHAIVKRANRYKKRAQKLLNCVVPNSTLAIDNPGLRSNSSLSSDMMTTSRRFSSKSGDDIDDAEDQLERQDSRDRQTNAKKAFEYATEARRLMDLLHSAAILVTPGRATEDDLRIRASKSDIGLTSSSSLSNGSVGADLPLDPPDIRKVTSLNSTALDSVLSEQTDFSEQLELRYHQEKMQELQLFSPTHDLPQPARCVGSTSTDEENLSDFYVSETQRLIRSFGDSSDELSVLTPFSADGSVMTTQSERRARQAHADKMQELELFSAGNMASNVWGALTGSFVPQPTVQEGQNEDDDDEGYDEGLGAVSEEDDSTAVRQRNAERQRARAARRAFLEMESDDSDSDDADDTDTDTDTDTDGDHTDDDDHTDDYTDGDYTDGDHTDGFDSDGTRTDDDYTSADDRTDYRYKNRPGSRHEDSDDDDDDDDDHQSDFQFDPVLSISFEERDHDDNDHDDDNDDDSSQSSGSSSASSSSSSSSSSAFSGSGQVREEDASVGQSETGLFRWIRSL